MRCIAATNTCAGFVTASLAAVPCNICSGCACAPPRKCSPAPKPRWKPSPSKSAIKTRPRSRWPSNGGAGCVHPNSALAAPRRFPATDAGHRDKINPCGFQEGFGGSGLFTQPRRCVRNVPWTVLSQERHGLTMFQPTQIRIHTVLPSNESRPHQTKTKPTLTNEV